MNKSTSNNKATKINRHQQQEKKKKKRWNFEL
jgi:hypothetical protein